MHGYYWHGMGMTFVWILWIPVTILIIWFFLKMINVGDQPTLRSDTSLEILNKRYANGEINTEEYEERKRVLELNRKGQ